MISTVQAPRRRLRRSSARTRRPLRPGRRHRPRRQQEAVEERSTEVAEIPAASSSPAGAGSTAGGDRRRRLLAVRRGPAADPRSQADQTAPSNAATPRASQWPWSADLGSSRPAVCGDHVRHAKVTETDAQLADDEAPRRGSNAVAPAVQQVRFDGASPVIRTEATIRIAYTAGRSARRPRAALKQVASSDRPDPSRAG